MTTAQEALERLREGNQRFTSGVRSVETLASPMRLAELAEGQQPFAIIVGCSDSRVPVETVFDQGLGDLFVVRVAGNIVMPSQLASVEFAVEMFGSRLVVVLGHSSCGAIKATIDQLRAPGEYPSEALKTLIEHIEPGIRPLLDSEHAADPDMLIHQSMRANVQSAVDHLRQDSPILTRHAVQSGLQIVGAEYSLETGKVTFLDV
ncbi:MAG: carbonic anhydrase [Gammaproteobacteria bacterium]|nr:carbonic anhydrase [Gammaproteobacteria bacterium]